MLGQQVLLLAPRMSELKALKSRRSKEQRREQTPASAENLEHN